MNSAGSEAAARFPNLFGIGVERCGTTWLHNMLASHAQVLTPRRKELFYFNKHFDKGAQWYLSQYDESDAWTYKADVTPSYFRRRKTLARIRRDVPDAKIIICVRHPVERAYSHYLHRIRHRALRPEGYGRSFWDEFTGGHRGYKELFPHYGEMLEPVLQMFPRKNILVMVFERDILALQQGMESLFSFLELEQPPLETPGKQNAGSMPRVGTCGAGPSPSRPGAEEMALTFWHAAGKHDISPADGARAQKLKDDASRWTRRILQSESEQLFREYFEEDATRFSRLFGVDIACWYRFRDIEYPLAGSH